MPVTVPSKNWFALLSLRPDWEHIFRQVIEAVNDSSGARINDICVQEILMAVPGAFARDWKYHQQVLTNKQKDVWRRVHGLDHRVSLSDIERVIERAEHYVPRS